MKDNNVDFGLRTFLKELGGIAGGTALLATVPWLSGCTPARLKETAGEVVRIGMIGTGSRGQFHLHNLKAIPAARVTVLCDTYEPNLRAAADIVGSGPGTRTAANSGTRTAAGAGSNTRTSPAGVKTCTDWRRVLDDPDVDAVIIATPLHLHAEMTIAALQAGKHVFCEKAMALTEEDCLAAYRAYSSGDRVLFYGMQRLFDPKYLEAIRLIHEGKIGDIVGMRCHWFRNADWRRAVPSPELERHINWRLYREYSGGLMTELGSHQLEVCNWALGLMPVQVTGMGDIVYWRDGREVFHLMDGSERMLPVNSPVLFHIQKLRDEVHRFAIGAHRAKRAKAIGASPLDEVPGIGPARKKALLMHFGTARAVRAASLEDLQKAPGVSAGVAQQIYDYFHMR